MLKGVLALVAFVGAVAVFVGLPWAGAALLLAALALILGEVLSANDRRRWRADAFVGPRLPAEDGHPIEHFDIKSWFGRASQETPPTFIERHKMKALLEGLTERRFVILTGPKESGKSRLAFEAAKRTTLVTMVASAPPPKPEDDPLMLLMKDPRGFPPMEEDQILFLTDLAKRLIAGSIDADSLSGWLKRHRNICVVAVLDPTEVDEVEKAGQSVEDELGKLMRQYKVVEVSDRLFGEELEEARREFGDRIPEEHLPYLPRYFASPTPLREKLEMGMAGSHELGAAIAIAVADWSRMGLGRPAPIEFVHRVVSERLAPDEGDFDAELSWATEECGLAALIYEQETDQGVAFVPDDVVVALLEEGELESGVDERVWAIAKDFVMAQAEGKARDEKTTEELLALAEAAMARGNPGIAYEAVAPASRLAEVGQQQRMAEILTSGTKSGLVQSRRGDGFAHRLKPVKSLAEGRRFRAGQPFLGTSKRPSRPVAEIYSRHTPRSAARNLFLAAVDVASVGFGLFLGVQIRDAAEGQPHGLMDHGLSDPFLVFWAGITVFVFASFVLYRKDSPRARLSAIVPAVAVFAVLGMAATLADGYELWTALLAAAVGGGAAFAADFLLRYAYDRVSRAWVEKNGLEARTLLIGTTAQVADMEDPIESMSRPSFLVGYLETETAEGDPDAEPRTDRLGGLENLDDVASREGVGRVVIVDPDLDPRKKQRLADRCHAQGLHVEALASLADIRTGSGSYVLGQSFVLVSLHPLWQRNTWLFIKLATEFVVALGIFVFLLPFLIAFGIAVAIDTRKSPLVRTWRPGIGGDPFLMYRFRTLPNQRRTEIALFQEDEEEDERSRLGNFLRDRGIDELPQLLNVLRGQMSLVGPRPLELGDHVRLADAELLRYVVRPGATGPWQVCRRVELTYPELTSMDMAYLRHWSFFTDLEILVGTAKRVLLGRDVPAIRRDPKPATGT